MPPLPIESYKKLKEKPERTPIVPHIIVCRCGARNIAGALRCWKCKRYFKSMKCPYYPSRMTRKDGRCKHFPCPHSEEFSCPATGSTYG